MILSVLMCFAAIVPPPEHPRLYLRAGDIPDLHRRIEHPVLKPVWTELQAGAKEDAQIRLEMDALRYLLDRDENLARETVAEALRRLQGYGSGSVKESSNSQVTGLGSREIGRMMVTGAIVYDWCYPVLTAEQKQGFVAELVRLAKELECGYPPDKGSFVAGHPSEWMIMRDMLSAGVAVYDEFPEMYDLAAGRFFSSHLPARNWFYPGGAYHQGPGYSDARFVSDMYPLWIFARMGAGNVYDPAQRYVPYEYIYERRPDDEYMWHGDGHSWPTRLGSLLCASYYHDGYVLANYLKASPKMGGMAAERQGYDSRLDLLYELLWRDPDLQPQPLTDLPLSRYMGFPFGWMVARTGWDDASVVASMRVNIYNFGNHQHNDGGSFEIYYKGPLAIHSGVYQGIQGRYGSDHHLDYYQRTIAHNSLLVYDPQEDFGSRRAGKLVNDGGQMFPGNRKPVNVLDDLLQDGHRSGEVLGVGFGPDPRKPAYTYLKGDITSAYSAKVREAKRSFVFLNLGDGAVPGALVVFDRVTAANPAFRKYWLLHSITEPAIEGNVATVTLERSKLVNTTLLPEHAQIAKVGGPGREFWVFGKNFPNDEEPPYPEAGAWRVELSPGQPAATDLFLNVIQVMDREGVAPLPVQKIESRGVIGVRLADRVVLFNPEGGRVTQPVRFAVRGTGIMRFLVADMAEGTWQVWRDGTVAGPAIAVTKDAGTFYFEGPAGSYALQKLRTAAPNPDPTPAPMEK